MRFYAIARQENVPNYSQSIHDLKEDLNVDVVMGCLDTFRGDDETLKYYRYECVTSWLHFIWLCIKFRRKPFRMATYDKLVFWVC